MSLTYSQFVTNFAVELGIDSGGTNFQTTLPMLIDQAEQRCYRDLDMQETRITDVSATLVPNSRYFTLPQSVGRFVIVEQISVFTPVGTSINTGGTRNILLPSSRDTINALWPAEAAAQSPSVPDKMAPLTDQIMLIGAPPDAAYSVEVQGPTRPANLSASNTTTLLSNYVPDLFFAAAMYFGAGYQKNFGAQADDPKMAGSWEGTYQSLLKSAAAEQLRKKFAASAWTAIATSPEASPPRN